MQSFKKPCELLLIAILRKIMQFVRLEFENHCSVQLSYGAGISRSLNDLLMSGKSGL
jgi:hypothetical protein